MFRSNVEMHMLDVSNIDCQRASLARSAASER
jgi:hypothetical protein